MKTIRWGMIGCGSVTEVKSGPGLYKAANSALVALTSRNLDAACSYAQRHGVPKVCASVEELLADAGVDAVYIATPPSTHKALAMQVARAGKHVYVEKPMAMRHAECEDIVAACRDNAVGLYVAFYRRAMPRFLQVGRWLAEGRIGEVRCLRLVLHQVVAPEELSADTLPWRVRPEISGGGKFVDMGVHQLDLFDSWFGAIEEARGIAVNRGGFYAADDTVEACWKHANGVVGSGSWCFVADANEDRVEITGSRGRIEFEFFSDKPLKLITGAGVEEANIPNPAHVQQPFIQSIVDELNGSGRCPGSVESAERATWVADRILADYRGAGDV